MKGPTILTENMLRSLSTENSFERGRQYHRAGAIRNATRQGNNLTALCEGSSAPAYRLRVELDQVGIRSAYCTCPYDWGGLCKHLIALLLTYIHQPEAFSERGSVADILAGLERDDLAALIEKLTSRDPDLYDWLEMSISQLRPKKEGTPLESSATSGSRKDKRETMVSEQTYRRQVKNILHSLDGLSSSQAYWGVSGMVERLEEVHQSAVQFLEAGDSKGAIKILMVLLQEVAEEYEFFDDSNGELGDFLDSLGLPLAEAILSFEMETGDRNKLEESIKDIWHHLSDYGIDGLDVAAAALKYGWEGAEPGFDEDNWQDDKEWDENDWDGYVIDELVTARLNVLERQGSTDEYLEQCLQSGDYLRYTLKLLEIGRTDEAASTAINQLADAEHALIAAQRLRELDRIEDALKIAERGFSLAGRKYDLGCWLGPLQEARGAIDQAILAYRAAFEEMPSLELYQTLKRISGHRWETIHSQLMDILKSSTNTHALVDTYLFEGRWDAATRLADQGGTWDYHLVEKVADAVVTERPDWVIQACRLQAEGLIERTQSKYYPHAARWLARMKQAYLQKGEPAEWEAYLSNLKNTYARRPALQAELKRL